MDLDGQLPQGHHADRGAQRGQPGVLPCARQRAGDGQRHRRPLARCAEGHGGVRDGGHGQYPRPPPPPPTCVAAATTCDLTTATPPAKAFLKAVIADLTTTYACTAVCTTATLSGTLGTSAGGTQLLASMDLDAAAAQFGDADAELGATMNAAARTANGALFNGVLMSWASTTTVTYRITS